MIRNRLIVEKALLEGKRPEYIMYVIMMMRSKRITHNYKKL